jgi:hypothetical protein
MKEILRVKFRFWGEVIACVLGLCAAVSLSYAEDATLARIVVIQPKLGKAAEFQAGYKRHLEWHRRNRDPWQWYGWTFVLGDRLGQFMDGTFGHTSSELDVAIKLRKIAPTTRSMSLRMPTF